LKLGVNVMSQTSREHTVYVADGLRTFTPAMVHTLADVIQNPMFDQQELKEAQDEYAGAFQSHFASVDVQMMEAIHAAAYHNNTVGLPSFEPANVNNFTAELLEDYIKNLFTGGRMVVSGVGVEHSSLVDLVQKEFGSLSKGSDLPTATATYTGGDVRARTDNPLCNVSIAFETANWHSEDLVAMCVLQMMMGGGGSFSAGGPGKGMYSRLYQNVLNKHNWAESANSFNSIFKDSAIFGIHGVAQPEFAPQLVDTLCLELTKMAGAVDAAELARTKAQLQSSVHMQLESRPALLEDMGRQVLAYGSITPAAELCQKITAVTAADIQKVAAKMLKTQASVAALGNISYVPRYDEIAKRFG